MVRTGVIGRGMASKVFHAPLVQAEPELELAVIAGSDGPSAVIADPTIDLVVIATPNATHFALAKEALRAGKHVVVDKPFAVSCAEAEVLIALAAKEARLLTVFHNRRWDGDFLTVRDILPRLGEVALYEAHWDRFRPAIKTGWREVPTSGAGLFFDLGPHLIDQALLLFGMPEALIADIAIQRSEAQVDDWFHLSLIYGTRRVVLSASSLAARPRPRFAIFGRRGAFIKQGLDPQEAELRSERSPLHPGFGEENPALNGSFFGEDGREERIATRPGRYLCFYQQVANAILRGGPPPVEPGEARDVIRILDLGRRSSDEGRRLQL